MEGSTSQRSLLNYAGIAILLVGMCVGEFIYWRSLQRAAGADDADTFALQFDSRGYERGMQENVGTFGLLIDQWVRAAARLKEPKPLAITIGVASLLAAGGCFLAASRMPRE